MKKRVLIALAMLAFAFGSYAQRTCQTMEVLEQLIKEDPQLQERMEQIEDYTQNALLNQMDVSGVITIPVVVHVLYNNSTENISDAQIMSQIAVLNADFKRLNADKNNTPSIFAGVAADVEIQFCLATVDPNGNPTTGITRTSTGKTSFRLNDDMKKSAKGGIDAWPCGSYMNMWVCDLQSGYLGYAQFPGGSCSTDGVVIDYAYFGTVGTTTTPYHLGRTATHEVGHWLNLRHIWGDGGCSVDDFIADTPPAGGANYTGAPCTFPGPNTCNTGTGDLPDMFQNYMDYSDDACMNLFTLGQKDRMRTLFASGGTRVSLLSSTACGGTPPPPPTPTCTDGIQNGNETGVDCGGPDCPSCNTGTCAPPTGLSSTPKQNGRAAQLSWNAASGATSYDWTITGANGGSASGTTAATSVTISGLTKNSSYTWTVKTNCGSTSSATISATFIAGQSARLDGEDGVVNFYPNPANDQLNIDLVSLVAEQAEVILMDLSGRVVVRKTIQVLEGANSFELDLSDCTNGVYVLTITSENLSETARISIAK